MLIAVEVHVPVGLIVTKPANVFIPVLLDNVVAPFIVVAPETFKLQTTIVFAVEFVVNVVAFTVPLAVPEMLPEVRTRSCKSNIPATLDVLRTPALVTVVVPKAVKVNVDDAKVAVLIVSWLLTIVFPPKVLIFETLICKSW